MPSFGCLYLHGFLSSPLSRKAQELETYFATHLAHAELVIPALEFAPESAIAQAEAALAALQEKHAQVFIIGSSLGGYYATYLAERHDIKAVLVNPAVRPYELFEHYLGPNQHFYNGETYQLTHAHIKQLELLDTPSVLHPERFLLLLQTADETLDYRLAAKHYQHATGWLEAGGNHSFMQFIERLPMILNWALNP